MQRAAFLPLLLSACAGSARNPPCLPVSAALGAEYLVRVSDPASKRVEVLARFGPSPSRDLRVRIDRRYAFLEVEAAFVEGLRASAGGRGLEVVPAGEDAWVVPGSRGREVELGWTVELRHREEIARRETDKPDQYEHPYLAADHGFLVGAAIFLFPTDLAGPFRVRFELPEGWPLDAPWESAPDGGFLVPDEASLTQNYLFLGRGRRMRCEVEGFAIDLAIAPGTDVPGAELGSRIERIAAAEIALLGRPRSARYLVVVPEEGRLRGAGGSAKRDSLVLAFGWGAGVASAEHLIAHELAHTLGPSRAGFDDEARFANEGFADYLGALARRRAGLLSERRFLEEVGRSVERWVASSERSGLSLAEAAGRFFADRDAYDMAYAGGLVLGFVLDHRIEGGLPALYRRLAAGAEDRPGIRELRGALADLGPEGVVPVFDRLVREPAGEAVLEEIPRPFEARSRREVDRTVGLEFGSRSEPLVSRVLERSPAAKAGLRSGDRILAFEGKPVVAPRDFFRIRRESEAEEFRVRVRRDEKEFECAADYGSRLRVSLSRASAGS